MYARRRHWYFAMMGTCVVLFVLAWAVVRNWSVPAAIGMCLVAMVIPPVAAIVANRRGPEDRWWDERRDPPDLTADPRPLPGPGAAPRTPGTPEPPGPPTSPGEPSPSKISGPADSDPVSDAWWEELDGGNRKDRHE